MRSGASTFARAGSAALRDCADSATTLRHSSHSLRCRSTSATDSGSSCPSTNANSVSSAKHCTALDKAGSGLHQRTERASSEWMVLSRQFLAHAPWAEEPSPDWLESALEAHLSTALEALPGEPLAASEFVQYLAQRLPEGVPLTDSLPRVRTADLRVAFGCVRGQGGALHRLEA